MPTNLPAEWFEVEKEFKEAKTREEKIRALEKLISVTPSHKGCENLRMQLKKKLAKLKRETPKKAKRKSMYIQKVGDAQVVLLGYPNSGKSLLLKKLTGVGEESEIPYSTQKPIVGTLKYEDVRIQMIEIPAFWKPELLSIARNADLVICLIDLTDYDYQINEILKLVSKEKFKDVLFVGTKSDLVKYKDFNQNLILVSALEERGLKELSDKIWEKLNLIRVYTKAPGKPKVEKPLILKKGSTVKDIIIKVHHDFLKNFRFARIWGSSKYPGEKVGLEYEVKDKDIVEIHS